MTSKTKTFLIATILLSAVLMFFVAANYISWLKAKSITEQTNVFRYNEKVLDFTKMFITMVLKSDGEITFEDRLQLENAVRAIGDKAILEQWQKFTKAKANQEIEAEAKNLLGLLLEKINQ